MERNERSTRRDDPCPCGSGRKFKKCHGASAPPEPDSVGVTADKPKPPNPDRGAAAASPENEADL